MTRVRILLILLTVSMACGLYFDTTLTEITKASAVGVNDGSVQVTAVDPINSQPIRYKIYPADVVASPSYVSMLNPTGLFTGLVPGSYKIYAGTPAPFYCLAVITIEIPYGLDYGVRWRIQHHSRRPDGPRVRIDIGEVDFEGEVTYLTTQENSHSLNYINNNADNIFEPVIGSELQLNLLEQNFGDLDDLTSCYDEKKYRASYYIEEGSDWVLYWKGGIVAGNTSQDYWRDILVPVTVMFSDGLADLVEVPFGDPSGNAPTERISILTAIVFILEKTGLQLDIWDQIYIREMASDENAIKQVYFDPSVYLQDDGTMEDSLTVLRSLLVNLGARVSLYRGVWLLEIPVMKTATELYVDKYDFQGTFLGFESDFENRISLKPTAGSTPKLMLHDKSSIRDHQPMYGRLKITYDFALEGDNNNLLIKGDFEEGINPGTFKNYTISTNSIRGTATSVAVNTNEFTISGAEEDGEKIFEVVFDNESIDQDNELYIIIAADPITLEDSDFKLKMSFDVRANIASPGIQVIPSSNQYAFFDYTILVTDDGGTEHVLYKNTSGVWAILNKQTFEDDLIGQLWTREYIDDSDQWKTVLADNIRMDSGIEYPATLELKIRVIRNKFFDLPALASLGDGFAYLEAQPTDNTNAGKINRTMNNRRRVQNIVGSNHYIRTYSLQGGEDTPSAPDTIKPDDNTTFIWKQMNAQYDQGNVNAWVRQFNIRRVTLSYVPDGEEDNELITRSEYYLVFNDKVKLTLPVDIRHGDLPEQANYKNITRGWFSLADGTPTSKWKFRGDASANLSLFQLLGRMYQGQYAYDRKRITGSVLCLGALPFPGRTVQEPTTGRVYVTVSSSMSLKIPTAQIAMIEALKGDPVSVDGDIGEEPPVVLREHSNEFSIEFS